jgi:hypothetical protein
VYSLATLIKPTYPESIGEGYPGISNSLPYTAPGWAYSGEPISSICLDIGKNIFNPIFSPYLSLSADFVKRSVEGSVSADEALLYVYETSLIYS